MVVGLASVRQQAYNRVLNVGAGVKDVNIIEVKRPGTRGKQNQ